jgi:hypothetical protein
MRFTAWVALGMGIRPRRRIVVIWGMAREVAEPLWSGRMGARFATISIFRR